MTVPIHRTAPDAKPGCTALYRFYSSAGALLYIGSTVRPKRRWQLAFTPRTGSTLPA